MSPHVICIFSFRLSRDNTSISLTTLVGKCHLKNDEVYKLGKQSFVFMKDCSLQDGHSHRLGSTASGQKSETDTSREGQKEQEFILNRASTYTYAISYGRSHEYL